MLRKANNVYNVILSDVTQLTAALPNGGVASATTFVTDANLTAGAVAVCTVGLKLLDATTFAALGNNDKFIIVQGKGTGQPLMKSAVLTKGTITSALRQKFVPATQQVTYVGYNPSLATPAGSLSAANSTRYWIKIRKRDNDAANRSQPMSLFAGPVLTDASATQLEVGTLLLKSAIKNFVNQEPANGYLKPEMVSDNAGVVPTGTTTIFTPTYGSKTVAIDGTLTNVAVGDYIRLEGTGATNAVYKVTAYTAGTSITLDTPYYGAIPTGGTFAIASTRVITAVLAAASNIGIRLTGVEAPFNVNSFRDYYANRFTVTFSDPTVPIGSTGASDGTGVWQKVAMDEYMSYGFEGANNQLTVPSIARDQVVKIPGINGNTALTSKYSCLTLTSEEVMQGLVSRDGGKATVVIYLNLANSGGNGSLTSTANTGANLVTTLGTTLAGAIADYNQ